MLNEVTTYYLEITDRAALRPARSPAVPIEIRQVEKPLPELNRFLYVAVGRDWHWRERLKWSRDRWLEYMGRPELETWVLYVAGTPAGYYEQDLQSDGNAEIVNFGMLPDFVAQGIGGHLLTHAVERGWQRSAPARVAAHLHARPSSGSRRITRRVAFACMTRRRSSARSTPVRSPGPRSDAARRPGGAGLRLAALSVGQVC